MACDDCQKKLDEQDEQIAGLDKAVRSLGRMVLLVIGAVALMWLVSGDKGSGKGGD